MTTYKGYTPESNAEEYYLASYREKAKGYPRIEVCVDLACFALDDRADPHVLLIKRGNWPYKGCWALPGGFLNLEETLFSAAARELHEETGVHTLSPTALGVADFVHRDPRGRVLSHVFTAHLGRMADVVLQAGDDAVEARWWALEETEALDQNNLLAFDHPRWIAEGANYWGLAAPRWEHTIRANPAEQHA